MTLSEFLKAAATERDVFKRARLVQDVVSLMRYKLHWTASQCEEEAVKSGIEPGMWQAMLLDADSYPDAL